MQRRGHLRALPGLRVDGEMANIAKIIVKPLQVHVCSIASVYVAGCAERRDPTEPGPGHGDSQLRGAVQPGQQQVCN